jgi:predicted permease
VGLPVCLFAFGNEGIGLPMMYFAVPSAGQFTIGPAIAAGRLDLRGLLKIPLIYAVSAALFVVALGLMLPETPGRYPGSLRGQAPFKIPDKRERRSGMAPVFFRAG